MSHLDWNDISFQKRMKNFEIDKKIKNYIELWFYKNKEKIKK
jgi:hypothetical protein